MKFENLNNNIKDCDAVSNASENNDRLFIRKLKKSDEIISIDFDTHFEQGKSPCVLKNGEKWKDCKSFKGCNSLSINNFEEEVKEEVLESYKLKFKVAPNYKGGAVIFKIKKGTGLVEHTPNKKDKNHYSFFKKDDFKVEEGIEVVELFALKDKCL